MREKVIKLKHYIGSKLAMHFFAVITPYIYILLDKFQWHLSPYSPHEQKRNLPCDFPC